MRARFPTLLASALSLGLALVPGCKRDGDTSSPSTVAAPKPTRRAGMPRPYRLPAKPDLAVYIEAPDEAMTAARMYAGGVLPQGRQMLSSALSASPTTDDRKLAAWVDDDKAWAAVRVENQDILWLPIRADRVGELKGVLAGKPPAGSFGAVNLQRTNPGPKLAWFDEQTGYLALADDEKGIATAPHIPFEYGKKGGFFVTITAEHARRIAGQAPFSRLDITGAGPHDFELVTEDTDVSQAPELAKLTEGALTGMLEAKQIAVAASSKYKDHAAWVKKVLGDTGRTVSKQNFLVRGNLEQLHRRLGAMLRSWDGRMVVGVGPKNHLLLGFGSGDPKKMGGATHHLIEGVRDNISMARQFGIDIPKVRWAKKKTTAAGHNIAVAAVESARKVVPKEFHSLIGERGDIRIAMAFPERLGGAMVVVGPSADVVLKRWLEQTQSAKTGDATKGDFAAATIAVDPKHFATIANGDVQAAAAKLLGLNAERDPTRVVVRRQDKRYEVRVKGPKFEAAPTRAASAGSRASTARRPHMGRSAGSRATGGKPVASKPTRSSRAKPTK